MEWLGSFDQRTMPSLMTRGTLSRRDFIVDGVLARLRWFRDGSTGIPVVLGSHPGAVRRGHHSGAAIGRSCRLTRNLLLGLA